MGPSRSTAGPRCPGRAPPSSGRATTFASGTTYDITNATAVNGAADFGAGVTVQAVGAVAISNGTLNFSTGSSITLGALTMTGGTLTGSDAVTVTGQTVWTGGTMSGTGSTVAQGGLQLGASNGNYHYEYLSGRSFTNAGAGVWTGSTAYYYIYNEFYQENASTFTNAQGATLDAQGVAQLYWQDSQGNSTFVNQGTLTDDATNTTTVYTALNNAGTVDVETGTLDLTGTFTNFSGTTLTGGTYLIKGTLQFTSANIQTDAANLILDGSSAAIVDQNGANALANFDAITTTGSFTIRNGYNLTTAGPLTNEGQVTVNTGSTLTVPAGTLYASSVLGFSSQYSTTNWSAAQALGAPNTPSYGDYSTAWSPSSENGTQEYLTLGFNTPVYSNGVNIWETDGNGFVTQVDVEDLNGGLHTVWTGTDPSQPGSPVVFSPTWTTTSYPVNGVKIYVNTNHNLSGWEEIDAVQIQGTPLGAYVQTSGSTTLSGGVLAAGAPVAILGGTLTGSGSINANVSNAGVVSPGTGTTPGRITINGSYTQTAAGSFNVKVGGRNTPGTDYDQLAVGGAADLGGTVNVTEVNGFTPQSGDQYQVLTYASEGGDFATRTGFYLGGGNVLGEQFNSTNLNLVVNTARLKFLTEPTSGTAGQELNPTNPVQVEVLDGAGNPITSDNTDVITLTLNQNGFDPASTVSATVSGGIATFSNLIIDTAATGYQLSASSPSLGAVASAPLFTITPDVPAKLVFLTQPAASAHVGDNLGTVTVLAEDRVGNLETTYGGQVTLALSSNPSALTGTTTQTASGGTTTFTTLSVAQAGTYQLVATSGTLTKSSSQVAIAPLDTAATVSAVVPNRLTTGASAQSITLTATVTNRDNTFPVNEGTVTFQVYDLGNDPVGSPVTSGTVAAGSASAAFTLPGSAAIGTYSVVATYTPGPEFLGSATSGLSSGTFMVVAPPVPSDLSAVAGENASHTITLSASDPSGDPLTYTVTGQPTHGQLSGTAPYLTYTPTNGYTGPDLFQYTVTDADTGYVSGTGTVSITVVPPPTAAGQSVSVNENTPQALTLSGTAPNGDPLSYTVTSPPTSGQLSGDGPNLTYTPTGGYTGADSFQYTVTDTASGLVSQPATVALTVNPATYVDLVVQNLAVSGVNSDGTFTVSWSTVNNGTGNLPSGWKEHLVIQNLTTGVTDVDTVLSFSGPLGVGGSAAHTLPATGSYTVNGAGRYQVSVTTNSDQSVYEYNPSGHTSAVQNDTSSVTLDVIRDLAVSNLTIASPVQAQSGNQVTVNWTDTNSGALAASGSWYDALSVVNIATNATVATVSVPFGGATLQPGANAKVGHLHPAGRRGRDRHLPGYRHGQLDQLARRVQPDHERSHRQHHLDIIDFDPRQLRRPDGPGRVAECDPARSAGGRAGHRRLDRRKRGRRTHQRDPLRQRDRAEGERRRQPHPPVLRCGGRERGPRGRRDERPDERLHTPDRERWRR